MTLMVVVKTARDSTQGGATVSGLVPVFVFFKRLADNADITPQPAIAGQGNGKYQFSYDPVTFGDATFEMDFGAALTVPADRYVSGNITEVTSIPGTATGQPDLIVIGGGVLKIDQTAIGSTNAVAPGVIDSTGGMCFPDRYDQTLTYNAAGAVATIAFTDTVHTWTQTFTYNASAQLTTISKWVRTP